jgi:hypothetical protein
MVEPDRRWAWKDEAHLAGRVEVGLTFETEAHSFRAEGERVLPLIEAGLEPFTEYWSQWRPDPAWPLPTLPAGWHALAGYNVDWNRVAGS